MTMCASARRAKGETVAEGGRLALGSPALTESIGTAPAPERGPVLGSAIFYLSALVAIELLIAVDAVASVRAWPVVALFHLSVLTALAIWVAALRRANRDTTAAMLALLLTAIAGPIGAVLALLYAPLVATRRSDGELLAAWYARLALSNEVDPAERLAGDIEAGRTVDPRAPEPAALAELFAHGTLEQRQQALGLIARQFHFDYGPSLSLALRSEEPVLRAQAAAVAARVRSEIGVEAARRIADPDGRDSAGEAALGTARWLERAAASGYLDPPLAERARLVARDLAGVALTGRLVDLHGETARIAEAELLRRGRFADFRLVRRLARIRATSGVRLRRIERRMPHRHLRRRPS